MEFQRILALRGPNVWARFPVLEAWLDLGSFKDSCSSELPGFNDRLKSWIPSLHEHRCSVGEPGGFYQRLDRGTYLAHILEHVALELQCLTGMKVGYGKTRMTHQDGVYKVALEYKQEEAGKVALEAARQICLAAIHGSEPDIQNWLHQIQETFHKYKPTAFQEAIRKQARKRGIPFQLLANGLIQLGQGARQRRIKDSLTDHTSAVASWIAYDWITASKLLSDVGLPVPKNQLVEELSDLRTEGERLGYPFILRPRYSTRSNPLVTVESPEAV
ncbi:MAG: cyanophycin synthetase family protein, partial [Planctomycetia bacterium]